MCPAGWSDEEGEGTDVCAEDVDKAVGTGVEKLKSGVAISWVAAGDKNEEGVEACSVANRSGVGVEAEPRRLHPRMKISVIIDQRSLALFVVQFD